jgi:hypothetical protein
LAQSIIQCRCRETAYLRSCEHHNICCSFPDADGIAFRCDTTVLATAADLRVIETGEADPFHCIVMEANLGAETCNVPGFDEDGMTKVPLPSEITL